MVFDQHLTMKNGGSKELRVAKDSLMVVSVHTPQAEMTLRVPAQYLELFMQVISDIASFTDYFVIVSGQNERQVQAISDEVYEQLKKSGETAARVEGYKTAEWILLDFGDFVVHVFEQKARQFYDLERLWRESKRVELPAEFLAGDGSSLRRES